MNVERRPVGRALCRSTQWAVPTCSSVFTLQMQSGQVRFVDGPEARRACAQLEALETEMRENGMVCNCPPGQS